MASKNKKVEEVLTPTEELIVEPIIEGVETTLPEEEEEVTPTEEKVEVIEEVLPVEEKTEPMLETIKANIEAVKEIEVKKKRDIAAIYASLVCVRS